MNNGKVIQLGLMYAKNHSTWMPKAQELRIQGQLGIHSNLQASLDYTTGPHLS